ncbi:MAG: sigma-70 family RNA polymerase sigma factor [Ignavibacteriales bacterium]|nr:sigma-70 family RNA polymerase sigma factor [Ignavibacteriales bacterium]
MDELHHYALRITGSNDDAKDLLQETYLKAYRFWDKYEKGTNVRAWLYRIMKNTYINMYRKEAKEPDMVDFDEIKEFYHGMLDDSAEGNDSHDEMFDKMFDDDVSKALASLPEDFRTVVLLCDIEGMSYEEIAEFVNVPVGTVRSRLHRGRKLLYSLLFDYAKKRGFLVQD